MSSSSDLSALGQRRNSSRLTGGLCGWRSTTGLPSEVMTRSSPASARRRISSGCSTNSPLGISVTGARVVTLDRGDAILDHREETLLSTKRPDRVIAASAGGAGDGADAAAVEGEVRGVGAVVEQVAETAGATGRAGPGPGQLDQPGARLLEPAQDPLGLLRG